MKIDRHGQTLTALLLGAFVTVLWAYWTTLQDIADRWATDPQYSHGFLVPLFSCYLLWVRRGQLSAGELGTRWWAVIIVVSAAILRMTSHFFYQPWLDAGSLLICLTGLIAAAGGRRALAWAAPAVLFLVFMLPLPYSAQSILGATLQRIATSISTYAMQTFGVPAVAEGNIILLTDTKLGVVEACNGISMLVTFIALATAVAMLSDRSLPEKAVIVASAIPIAVFANVTRITVTGLLFEAARTDLARAVFHDVAGWLMMPLALVILVGELFIMNRSVVRVERTGMLRNDVAAIAAR